MLPVIVLKFLQILNFFWFLKYTISGTDWDKKDGVTTKWNNTNLKNLFQLVLLFSI